MLQRIQEIKSVGCFADFRAGAIQFEPLTFIYGENCYGKSTLCDIFRSLAENNPKYISDRISVPNPQNQIQQARINFLLPEEATETTFVFSQNHWNSVVPQDLNIFVFDTDFIHRNVFTGLTIKRENQENITQFVLGEGSVEKAQKISELRSELRALNKLIRHSQETTFSGIDDIVTFISMKVDETSDELSKTIASIIENISEKKYLLENIEKALKRDEPKQVSAPGDLAGFIQRVNTCLKSTYQRAHEDATKTVEEHIRKKTQAIGTTKNWLRQGLDLKIDNTCPFCGQEIVGHALDLIDAYKAFFDDTFNRFVSNTTKALTDFQEDFDKFGCSEISTSIRENNLALSQYTELMKDDDFKKDSIEFQLTIPPVFEKLKTWQENFQEAEKSLASRIKEKEKAIYNKIEDWDCDGLLESYQKLLSSIGTYNERLNHIFSLLQTFKRGLSNESIRKELSELEKKKGLLTLNQKRNQLDGECVELLKQVIKKDKIEKKIEELNKELAQQQTDYLNQYFTTINNIFKKLGSEAFEISKQISQRGNMPVIELTASYCDEPVNPARLHAFFSESDRRALALSIFWAKITSLLYADKSKSIIILDDPVTSFDDGRIDRTIRLMDMDRPTFRQVIVLSHYPIYLRSFFERANLQTGGIQLTQIKRTHEGSKLELASPADFVETAHQLKFRTIKDFVERRNNENVQQDLRIYLETEVKLRYHKQIIENGIGELGFKYILDRLHDGGILSSRIRSEIEQYRLSLNVDHHTWTRKPTEEQIGLAADVMEFIYERL